MVDVVTSPPNVLGNPGPASSISTIRMFGAPSGRRRGSILRRYVDSCRVRPDTLAEGTGANGRTSPPGIGSGMMELVGTAASLISGLIPPFGRRDRIVQMG